MKSEFNNKEKTKLRKKSDFDHSVISVRNSVASQNHSPS